MTSIPDSENSGLSRLFELQGVNDWKLFLSLPFEGIHILDSSGILKDANDSFCARLGYLKAEIRGMHVSSWDARWDDPLIRSHLEERILHPTTTVDTFNTLHRTKDGRLIPVEIRTVPIKRKGQVFLYCSSRDLTSDMRARHLGDFNELLVRINQAIATIDEEQALISRICELAVEYGHLDLVWIGRPDDHGTFRFLSASGATGYLDGILISADPSLPEGQGPAAVSYREDRIIFNATFETNPAQSPWRERARQFHFHASAAIPIHRSGHVWGVLVVYHKEMDFFDEGLKSLLQEVSLEISRGFDHLDTSRREKELSAIQSALIDNTVVGITVVKDRKFVYVNTRLLKMLGYQDSKRFLGESTRILYPDDLEYDRIGSTYRELGEKGQATINDVRARKENGDILFCDVSVRKVPDSGGISVWTIQDVTDRHRSMRKVHRLLGFTSMLAQVNMAVASVEDEQTLMQSICDYVVFFGQLSLAWIGRPDGSGRFYVLASAGATGYLEQIFISSDPSLPEGQGPTGRSFREGVPVFSDAHWDSFAPWRDRARQFGLESSVSLPIHRGAGVWGVLVVYHRDADIFEGEDLKAVFEELVQDISRGLDRLDSLKQQMRLSNALASIEDGVSITDSSHRVNWVNKAFVSVTGYGEAEVQGKNLKILQGPETSPETVEEIRRALASGTIFRGEIKNVRKDGSSFWNLLTINPIRSPDGTISGFVGVQRNITDMIQLKEQLEFQSLHDPLTGLPNRRALDQHLSVAMARARRNGTLLAVALIDLDDFKIVNDQYGHEAGDSLLVHLVTRFRDRLRENDFLVRLGGDEFVIVIEDLSTASLLSQIEPILNRLHESVETSFDLSRGQSAYVGMSLGMAVYPQDATEGDALLRLADMAMYQVKERKHGRKGWWQRGDQRVLTPGPQESDEVYDPYGKVSKALLIRYRGAIEEVLWQFVRDFYEKLVSEPEPGAILQALSEAEMSHLKDRQIAHLRFLLDPDTTRENLLEKSRETGRVHSLVGVGGALLLQAKSIYTRLLTEAMNQSTISQKDRYRLLVAAEGRLHDDIEAQLRSQSQTMERYLRTLSLPLPAQGTRWADARAIEMAELGNLPGIQVAFLLRPDSRGVFVVEESGGPKGAEASNLIRAEKIEPVIDPDSPKSQGLLSQAWRSLHFQTSPSYQSNPNFSSWHDAVRRIGIRSMMVFLVRTEARHVVALVALYGHYPNQFESSWMQQFIRGMEQRWERIWHLCQSSSTVVGEDKASEIRKELFNGGLSMWMQPVVDFATGRTVRVEALARLVCQDGTILLPKDFLPVLGEAELDRLFREGLDMTLGQLAAWDREGFSIDASVNLPPDTLKDPECFGWVEEALKKSGISPDRLTLELLESQSVDLLAPIDSMVRLRSLGVKLAMDDLGSGYSSLERLSNLPFDSMKVDQSLLKRVRVAPIPTINLIASIIRMGFEFGHLVVVEGLEDPGLVEMASVLGADGGQGFALAKPMAPEQVASWARSFIFLFQEGQIRTYLGCLAYFWRNDSLGKLPSIPLASCPVTTFLSGFGYSGSDPLKWHASLHERTDDFQANSKKFLSWLVDRVVEEGKTGSD